MKKYYRNLNPFGKFKWSIFLLNEFVLLLIILFAQPNLIHAQNHITNFQKSVVADYQNTNSVKSQIITCYPELIQDGSNVVLQNHTSSPFADYYSFIQQYNGILIQDATIKICIDKNGIQKFITGNYFTTSSWEISGLNNNAIKLNIALAEYYNIPIETRADKKIIVSETNIPQLVYAFDYLNPRDKSRTTIILNEDLEILSENDHRSYFSAVDSTVTGKIFKPDPLTSAETNYAGAYRDFNDADTAVLTAQLFDVTFKVQFENDTFFLRTDSVIIKDLNAPSTPVVTSLTPDFNFTRSASGFEDVNAFYHIINFSNYILSLGYINLQNFYIEIDPHGASGADQSFYVSAAIPTIQFGEGGVDDAEDADAIVHEFTHAISDKASPESNSGLERRALDEGYGDYFAASYSRMFSDYHWNLIFSWDGHNEFWNGRNANTNKHYPEDNSADYYGSSEIWSGALMDIFDAIGKENTDKIVLESLYGSFPNMTMPDAAQMILSSEETLFGGLYYSVIYDILDLRGLFTLVPIDVSNALSEIQFINSDGFTFRDEALIIKLPLVEQYTLEIFDIEGKLIHIATGNSEVISILPSSMQKGINIIRITTAQTKISYKIEKL